MTKPVIYHLHDRPPHEGPQMFVGFGDRIVQVKVSFELYMLYSNAKAAVEKAEKEIEQLALLQMPRNEPRQTLSLDPATYGINVEDERRKMCEEQLAKKSET